MEPKSTHIVEVVPVVLEPHPDPETVSLSVVRVYNYQVVVRTEDWIGVDKAAYVPPDNILPDKPEYRFLKITGNIKKDRDALIESLAELENEPFNGCRAIHQDDVCDCAAVIGERYRQELAALEAKIDANTKRLRITVQKLRGVLSMGMLLPIPKCQLCVDDLRTQALSGGPTLHGKYHELGTGGRVLCTNCAEVGDDVAELLEIGHYEPPAEGERLTAKGDDVGPAPAGVYAPKYDVESLYRYAECFEAGEPVYVTEKLDGQNFRAVAINVDANNEQPLGGELIDNDDVFNTYLYAGSRSEWKLAAGNSNWWKVQQQNPWIRNWCKQNPAEVLYGECYGRVQSLRYGAKQGQLFFRAFDILNGTEYLDAEAFIDALSEDRRVPVLGIMPFNFEELQRLADGPSLVPGANHMREGLVIRPVKERRHWKLGRVLLKLVSSSYLEKSNR